MVRVLRELVLSLLMAAALFAGVDTLTARSYVDGPSMEPTLYRGQILLLSRVGISGLTRTVYAATHPEDPMATDGWVPPRGSIITFTHPADPPRVLIKRVIGLPGERIAIRDGVVYVDGQRLEEPYVVFHDSRSIPPQLVPLDSIFVLGDNRPASADSRVFGPVPRANLLGIAAVRYWPLEDFRVMLSDS